MILLDFSLPKLWDAITGNVSTVAIFISIVVAIFLIAFWSEKIINKANERTESKQFRVHRITIIAMLSAVAILLNLLSFPLWFAPSFYKLDFSELPVLVGAFALGPVAGTTIEAVKILLNLVINGTGTAFIGEIANFVVGCAFVIPAAIVYYHKRTKKGAVVGLAAGTVVNLIVACLMNAFVLIPTYGKLFHMDVIGAGTAVNSLITDMTTFVLLAVAPFNLIKSVAVAVITALIYKPISRLISGVKNR
ncbi:MAG: ECF transporter S component [Lachnospiraceae bacterium]|nr:ECF transporter S component [Lachnospiraceae bacterium]